MNERPGKDATPAASYFADFASSYGEEVDLLLRHLFENEPRIHDYLSEFADSFYKRLNDRTHSSMILARLSPDELHQLKLKQAQHLEMLLSQEIPPLTQYERALKVGWIHEMVGVSLPMMMETYHLYHAKIDEILSTTVLTSDQRSRLRMALNQRVQLDVEAQMASHARFDDEIASVSASLDEAIQKAGNLADMLRSTLQALGDFEGIATCLFSRPDAHGVMQIEAEGGKEGPAGRAWRSGQIQVNDSFQGNVAMHAWSVEALRRGFRSSAAVPLLDESGQSFAILNLYTHWTGFFTP